MALAATLEDKERMYRELGADAGGRQLADALRARAMSASTVQAEFWSRTLNATVDSAERYTRAADRAAMMAHSARTLARYITEQI
jgi:hypothetical protein